MPPSPDSSQPASAHHDEQLSLKRKISPSNFVAPASKLSKNTPPATSQQEERHFLRGELTDTTVRDSAKSLITDLLLTIKQNPQSQIKRLIDWSTTYLRYFIQFVAQNDQIVIIFSGSDHAYEISNNQEKLSENALAINLFNSKQPCFEIRSQYRLKGDGLKFLTLFDSEFLAILKEIINLKITIFFKNNSVKIKQIVDVTLYKDVAFTPPHDLFMVNSLEALDENRKILLEALVNFKKNCNYRLKTHQTIYLQNQYQNQEKILILPITKSNNLALAYYGSSVYFKRGNYFERVNSTSSIGPIRFTAPEFKLKPGYELTQPAQDFLKIFDDSFKATVLNALNIDVAIFFINPPNEPKKSQTINISAQTNYLKPVQSNNKHNRAPTTSPSIFFKPSTPPSEKIATPDINHSFDPNSFYNDDYFLDPINNLQSPADNTTHYTETLMPQYWYQEQDIVIILEALLSDSMIEVCRPLHPYLNNLQGLRYTHYRDEQKQLIKQMLLRAILMANASSLVSVVPINTITTLKLTNEGNLDISGDHWVGVAIKNIDNVVSIIYLDSLNYVMGATEDITIDLESLQTSTYAVSHHTKMFLELFDQAFQDSLTDLLNNKLQPYQRLPIKIVLKALHQQTNSYDCGPLTIYNLCDQALGLQPPLTSTEELRRQHNAIIQNYSKKNQQFQLLQLNYNYDVSFSLDEIGELLNFYLGKINADISYGNIECLDNVTNTFYSAINHCKTNENYQSFLMLETPLDDENSLNVTYIGLIIRTITKTIASTQQQRKLIEIFCIDPCGAVYKDQQTSAHESCAILIEENLDFYGENLQQGIVPDNSLRIHGPLRRLFYHLLTLTDTMDINTRNSLLFNFNGQQQIQEPNYQKSAALVLYNFLYHGFDIDLNGGCSRPTSNKLNNMMVIFADIIKFMNNFTAQEQTEVGTNLSI